jgi:hypothetical protein
MQINLWLHRATYFSLTPGRKLYDIISAAHAVFDKLADEAAGAGHSDKLF